MAINTMFTEGSGKNDDEAFPSSSGGFWEFFNSLSGFAFAYAGQTIYLEMMSEMKKPTKFRQALSVGAPGIFVLYMATAIIQYALRGRQQSHSSSMKYLMEATKFSALSVF